MGMGVFPAERTKKIPGAHKIGAAISGPRIAGGRITDMRLFIIMKTCRYRYRKGRKKHINFFNISFLPPPKTPPFWPPRKEFMCLISWERTQKRDPHKLFGGNFGVLNGPFSATKSLLLGFPGPATGVIWALRAQSWKKSLSVGSGAFQAPGPKSRKRSRKRVNIVEKQSILTLFRLHFRFFGAPGPKGPGNSFSDSFSNFGPEGPK